MPTNLCLYYGRDSSTLTLYETIDCSLSLRHTRQRPFKEGDFDEKIELCFGNSSSGFRSAGRQDSAGRLSRVRNLSVQIHLTASFVEAGGPLPSADRQNQARSDQQRRTIFGQSSLCSKPPMFSAIPTALPPAVRTGVALEF